MNRRGGGGGTSWLTVMSLGSLVKWVDLVNGGLDAAILDALVNGVRGQLRLPFGGKAKEHAKDLCLPGHEVPRVDLHGAAVAHNGNTAVPGEEGQIFAEIYVGEILDDQVHTLVL